MDQSITAETTNSVLTGTVDNYGGMNVPAKSLPGNDHDFAKALHESMEAWKTRGIRGVWISIPIEKSSFISIAAELGFKFHHAKDNIAVINNWLPVSDPNKLPLYPFTTLGVGGMVFNDKQHILVVREKYGGPKAPWKLPGGAVDPKEELSAAAMREVLEETNIQTEFVSIIGFRHFHGTLFDTSDVYFIVRLKPLTEEITFDKSELVDARWMDIDEYIADNHVTDFNRWVGKVAKSHLADPTAHEFSTKVLPSWNRKSTVSFYGVQPESDAKL